MAYTIKNNTKVAIKRESPEGEYEAPSSGADFVEVLADGFELNPAKEQLDRSVLGMGLSKKTSRVGMKSVSGSLPVYMKAGSTAGSEPEYGLLIESALGNKRLVTATVSEDDHTTTQINMSSMNAAKYQRGDIVLIKEAGAFHKSPISAVGATSITLLVPMASAPADEVAVEALVTYRSADAGHPSISITKYVENAVKETAFGTKVTSMSVESFTTGQLATLNFSMEGANYDRALEAPAYSPVFDTSETPIVLKACIYQNGQEIEVNEFSLSVENALGFIQDTCNGKRSSRVTERNISGSINPYKLSDSLAQFQRFDQNIPFSLFISAHNPTAVDGEFKEVISFFLPVCTITELGESDLDGVLQDSISFKAASDQDGRDLYISMS